MWQIVSPPIEVLCALQLNFTSPQVWKILKVLTVNSREKGCGHFAVEPEPFPVVLKKRKRETRQSFAQKY